MVAFAQFLGSGAILIAYGRFLWGMILFDRRYPNHEVLHPAIWAAFVAAPICFSLLGIVTSIGLLRLREWARRGTILLSTVPVLGGAALAALHPPLLFPSQISGIVFAIFMYVLATLAVVSIWWLVVMTRKSVRDQFL
jgi:hypothetical protein